MLDIKNYYIMMNVLQYHQLTSMFKWTLLVTIVLQCILGCTCSPPEEPITCYSPNNTNCTISNAYGAFPDRSICRAAQVVYPSTEEELISIVAAATKKRQKMKVATSTSHSITKLVCVDGEDGLLISTRDMDRVLEVNRSAMTMTVASGMTLRDFLSEAAKVGLAFPYTPYWWGLTMGGLLGTGAQGSSLWDKGGSVPDYVVRLRIVTPASPEEGYAKVRTLVDEGAHGDEFNAAKVSLGVLGVISQITFQMQPMFKRSITYVMRDDKDVGEQVTTFGRKYEFADIVWWPSRQKADYRYDNRVAPTTPGNGYTGIPIFRPTPPSLALTVRSREDGHEIIGDVDGICNTGINNSNFLQTVAYGLTNDGTNFTGYPIIGYHNNLQASGDCFNSPEDGLRTICPWDTRIRGLFFYQHGFTVPLSKVKYFIQDVQKLVKLSPKGLCSLNNYNGLLMRYVTHSNAFLGKDEDAVDFDGSYYRSRDPNAPRLYGDFNEEIEQLAMFKYGGMPHWGKNRNAVFKGAIKKFKNARKFFKVKDKYDPLGLFSNEWTDQVLGLKGDVSIVREGCALEGLCICSQDIHCAPSKGYFCRPGKVYKAARVCTFLGSQKPN